MENGSTHALEESYVNSAPTALGKKVNWTDQEKFHSNTTICQEFTAHVVMMIYIDDLPNSS